MLLSTQTAALNSYNQAKLISIELKLQREIRRAKRTYAKTIELEFKTSDMRSWKRLKEVIKLNNCPPKKCDMDPDTLNDFYLCFEKIQDPPELPPISSNNTPKLTVKDVVNALRLTDTWKSCGPDGIPGKQLKTAAYALGHPLCYLFNNCIMEGMYPYV